MKILLMFLLSLGLVGCASHPRGVSHLDRFDDVQVEQMVGNKVSGAVLQKTVVCLNARRETRHLTGLTNVVVSPVTNITVAVVTNETVSASTNYYVTTATNLSPLATTTLAETATAAPAVHAPVAVTTNLMLTLAQNSSGTTSPTQTAANRQVIRTLNNQITTVSDNLAVSLATNLVVTIETNQLLTYVTNVVVSDVTNVTYVPTNGVQHDCFLYTEVVGAPDFTLQSGESLVLLVDGRRYGFSPGQSSTVFVSREGWTSTLYRIPPEVLVAIANAQEVRLRIKGHDSTIERTLSRSSKRHFKQYLLKYFTAAKPRRPAPSKTVSAGSNQMLMPAKPKSLVSTQVP